MRTCSAGFLCQTVAGWRSLFYIQAGLGAFFTVVAWFALPPSKGSENSDLAVMKRVLRIDWVGAVLVTGGLGLLTFSLALSQFPSNFWNVGHLC